MGVDKSLARHTPRCRRTESIVSLERGVCSYSELSFLVTEAERKHVRRGARFQQHREASCRQVLIACKARSRRKFTPFLQTVGEYAPSYTTVKNWVAQFKRGDFSTCDAPRPGGPKTVTTSEIMDQNHEIILQDTRISAIYNS